MWVLFGKNICENKRIGSPRSANAMYKVTQLSWERNRTMSVMRFHAVTLQWFSVTMVQTSLKYNEQQGGGSGSIGCGSVVDLHKKIWCAPLSKMDPMRSFYVRFAKKRPYWRLRQCPPLHHRKSCIRPSGWLMCGCAGLNWVAINMAMWYYTCTNWTGSYHLVDMWLYGIICLEEIKRNEIDSYCINNNIFCDHGQTFFEIFSSFPLLHLRQ